MRTSLLFTLLLGPTALAQTPIVDTLIADLDQRPASGSVRSSHPEQPIVQPGRTLFTAATPGLGFELWATDGTPGNLVRIDEVNTGPAGIQATITHPDGTAIVSSPGDGVGREPHAIAPGSHTYALLGDLRPGLGDSNPRSFVVWQGDVWFVANDGALGYRLYRTDGTAAGTTLVEILLPGAQPAFRNPGVQVGNGGTHLYLSFTGPGGALLVKTSPSVPSRAITPGGLTLSAAQLGKGLSAGLASGIVFYMESAPGRSYEPWFTDGTSAGTIPLGPLDPGNPNGSQPRMLGSDDSRVWFDASSPAGRELWITDGTPAGTRMVVDLLPGSESGRSGDGFVLLTNGDALFSGTDTSATAPPILFRSDGTAAGTRRVPASPSDGRPTSPDSLMLHQGSVWMTGTSSGDSYDLWSYDPLADALARRWSPPTPSTALPAVLLGPTPNGLLLRVDDGIHGREPWLFDPTTNTGSLLANLYPDGGNRGSSIAGLGSHRGLALFQAIDGVHGVQVWATDGSSAGTQRITNHVGDILRQLRPVADTFGGFVYLATRFPFPATPTTQLWSTDGSPGTDVLLHDFRSNGDTILVDDVLRFEGRILFRAGRFQNQVWWESDGTPAGTRPYAEFSGFPDLELSFEHRGLLWGTNQEAGRGREVWVSDGTAAGTRLVFDIAAGLASSRPEQLHPVPGGILFAADDGLHGAEPWFSDGTATGTRLVSDLNPGPNGSRPRQFTATAQGVVFQAATSSAPGRLWRTDGTASGTQPLGQATGAPAGFAAANGRALFWNEIVSPSLGNVVELWRTDGTASGTFGTGAYVQEFDTANAPPLFVLGDGDEVAFQGFGATHGVELWLSDGTVAGTRVLADSAAGPEDSLPMDLIRAGNHLLFTADSLAHGRELHGIPYAPTGAWLARPFGRGCGAELAVSGSATLGASLTLDVSSAPGAATALLFGLDRDDTALAPGCFRHVAVPITVGALTADAQGVASFPLAVPNVPALVGDLLHFQAFAAVPGGPLLGAVAGTPGLEVVLGR